MSEVSYWDFQRENTIEIPRIQRDYAQGRPKFEKLLRRFLEKIKVSLENDSKLNLDFIYGNTENSTFQPLDGQQRLTTLFLLHWYALQTSGSISEENVKPLMEFKYETRPSARDFCELLSSLQINVQQDSNISEIIQDNPSFFTSWHKDVTVVSMLNTLNKIHEYFYDFDNLWQVLTVQQKIQFHQIELSNIGLSDDLYIKMNSRGKLLTPYENFKAGLQKRIDELQVDRGLDLESTTIYKLDTIWSDLFWEKRSTERIDNGLMRMFNTIYMIDLALGKEPERLERIQDAQREDAHNDLSAEDLSVSCIQRIKRYLTIYERVYQGELNEPRIAIHFWQHGPSNDTQDIFKMISFDDDQPSYSQKVLFFAHTEYLYSTQEEVYDDINYRRWIKVIRNVLSRGDVSKDGERPAIVRSQESFYGAIGLVNELLEGVPNILHHLTQCTVVSSFARSQVNEEIFKAKTIHLNEDSEDLITRAENSNLLRGRVAILFDTLDFTEPSMPFPSQDFESLTSIIQAEFDDETISNDIRRLLLITPNDKGEYRFYDYWKSGLKIIPSQKRKLIPKFRELEYIMYNRNQHEFAVYIRNMLLSLLRNYSIQEQFLNFKDWDQIPKWQRRVASEPELLDDHCPSKHIAIPEDNEEICYLLQNKRPREEKYCYLVD